MHSMVHWLMTNANLLAILVTVGVAVLLVCCLECTKCPCREKDDISPITKCDRVVSGGVRTLVEAQAPSPRPHRPD